MKFLASSEFVVSVTLLFGGRKVKTKLRAEVWAQERSHRVESLSRLREEHVKDLCHGLWEDVKMTVARRTREVGGD